MTAFTKVVYALLGTFAVVAGVVALVMPSLALPPGITVPIASHLVREEASAFVFIGLMFVWLLRHAEQGRPVHLALLVFTVLFAAIHWADYLKSYREILSPLINSVPAVLLAATIPKPA